MGRAGITGVAVVVAALAACRRNGDTCYVPTASSRADICALIGDACAVSVGDAPGWSPARVVVPPDESQPIADGVVHQAAHNNLDIVWHGDRLFFAFRTAPNHFASEQAKLYVVSTQDQESWTLEATFDRDTDLREPRFLSIGDRLFLYYAELGHNPFGFEPRGAWLSERTDPCQWSEPERLYADAPGFIPWRAKTVGDVGYLIGYDGGENLYRPGGGPVRVHWLATTDGRTFAPAVPGQPVVLTGGASETDLVRMDDGTTVAVARQEIGDTWGSQICRGDPSAPGAWTCAHDRKKYDSPLLFRRGDEIWMIARRQLDNDGNYDLARRDLSAAEQTALYSGTYWLGPKRCALWKVDGASLTTTHVLDLPSAGDTCFPGVVQLDAHRYLVYNYSSPLDDPDISWVKGQLEPTFIYRTTLTLP